MPVSNGKNPSEAKDMNKEKSKLLRVFVRYQGLNCFLLLCETNRKMAAIVEMGLRDTGLEKESI